MKRSGWFASFVVLPAVVAGGPLASLAGAGAPPPTCEPAWTPLFGGAAGVDQQIHDFAIFDDGQGGGPALFAGGQFTSAGGTDANHIARWGCPTTPACVPADLNCDGAVDGSDLGLLLGAWGACPKAGACDSDLNDDGFVDGGDLGILLVAW